MTKRRIVIGIRIVTIAAIAVFALTTPGFTSPLSINALLNAISGESLSSVDPRMRLGRHCKCFRRFVHLRRHRDAVQ